MPVERAWVYPRRRLQENGFVMRVILRMATLGALALGGCAGPVIHSTYLESGYAPSHVTLAAANNPALAVIRNNPFAADHGNEAVLAAIQARNFGPKLYFSQTPRAEDRYGYKVVLDFGQGAYATAELCRQEAAPAAPRPPGSRIDVSAAFCIGRIPLSETTGWVEGVDGPNDLAFRNLMSQIMLALTPPVDPRRNDHDEMCPAC